MKVKEFIQNEREKIEKGKHELYEIESMFKFLKYLTEKIKEKYGVQCECVHVGSLDSPGYDMECYALSYIDEEGTLILEAFKYERY